MAETLGSLIDKLTIVKLKQFHCEDDIKMRSLSMQQKQLQEEIDDFFESGLSGQIPLERLVFASNKVYRKDRFNQEKILTDSIGFLITGLAEINCKLWHEQEKIYDFENIQISEKDKVVNSIAILNLERNKYIDEIDRFFQLKISEKLSDKS